MKYTLGQAAKEINVSKPTLSRALKKGDLSAEGGNGKPYQIDSSELGRWLQGYRERNPDVFHKTTPYETQETSLETKALQEEIKALHEQLQNESIEREREREQFNAHIEDLRGRIERSDKEKDQLTALLTDERQKEKKGFFKRLFG